jgi:16S rRNA processing protein RimM
MTAFAFDPATAITIGRVTAPHGVRGDVRVELQTDYPERFEEGSTVWLDGAPRRISSVRWGNGRLYLRFDGVASRTEAEALAGATIQIPASQAVVEEGAYHLHQIVGLRVHAKDGAYLGTVADVLRTGANDVYVIEGEPGRLLVPAIADVVKEIDVRGGRIVVDLLEGLDWEQPKTAAQAARRRIARKRPG